LAALVHFGRRDATQRTTTSSSAVEVTQHTVAWSDLTGAGFANGDEVLILVRAAMNIDNANGLLTYAAGRGTTFAGRTQWADSVSTIEGQSTTATRGHHYGWLHKHTLVTNENIYLALTAVGGTNTARVTDYSIIILKLTGLGADDYKYTETADSGDAPTSYDTGGASVTLPGSANSDWLVLSTAHWLIDSTTADLLQAIDDNGADFAEVEWEGEDVAEERTILLSRFIASVAADRVIRARYRVDTATTHDVDMSKVFALRLNAFVDHSGVQSTATITHTATATYQEAATIASHPVTATGDHFIFAESVSDSYGEATKNPFSRIQVAGADWPEAGMGDGGGAYGHGAADKHAVCQFGIASLTAGTTDVDWDLQEAVDVTPNYSHSYHTLVAFSMELVAAGSVAASAGVGAAAAIGLALFLGIASAAGLGAATGVGASTAASTAASAGVGDATGAGSSVVDGVGSAAGLGDASAAGQAIVHGVASAQGVGEALGVGISTSAAVADSAGTGAATGVGASTAASAAAATGTGDAVGVGISTAASAGSALGTGTASGVGAKVLGGIGIATGGGAAVQPNTVPGLRLWLRGDSITEGDGASIATWLDDSGNGFSMSGGATPPTAETNEANGHKVARFNGTDDFMNGTAISNILANNAGTIFVVARAAAVTSNNANVYNNVTVWADSGTLIGCHLKSAPTVHAYNWDGDEDSPAGGKPIVVGTWFIHTWMHDSGTLYGGKDDARTAAMGSVASGNTTSLTGTFRLGTNNAAAGRWFNGDIAELVCFNVALSQEARVGIAAYLAATYAITDSSGQEFGVGSSTAAATASASGTGAASGVGRSTTEAVGASAGTGEATAVGSAIASGVGSAAGTSTATGVGASTAEAVGSAAGTGTATAQSEAASVGAAAGTSTASAVGAATAAATGAAAGTGAASGVGASTAAADGSSSGTGTASSVGAATASGVASSSGAGTATGVGHVVAEGVGSASGVATAAAIGEAGTTSGAGEAAGTGIATGVGASTASATAAASGVSTSTGIGVATAEGVGSAAGVGTAAATPTAPVTLTGIASVRSNIPTRTVDSLIPERGVLSLYPERTVERG